MAGHGLGRFQVGGDQVPRTWPRGSPVAFALDRFLLLLFFLFYGSLVEEFTFGIRKKNFFFLKEGKQIEQNRREIKRVYDTG